MMMFDGAGDSTDYLGAVFIIVSISAGGGAGAGCHGTGTFVAMNTEHIVTSGILVEADTAKHDS